MSLSIWLFISFALGIIAGKLSSLNFFFLISLAVSSLILTTILYKKQKLIFSDLSILILFFFLGFIWIKPYAVVLPGEVLSGEAVVYGKITTPDTRHPKKSVLICPKSVAICGLKKIPALIKSGVRGFSYLKGRTSKV